MIDPTLALQALIRARLVGSSELTALVPADAIRDTNRTPDRFPCIIIGAGNATYPQFYQSYHSEAFEDLHVWVKEDGLETAKRITGAMRQALDKAPWSVEGHIVHALNVQSVRFLRDPSGEHSHAVLSIKAIMQERAS